MILPPNHTLAKVVVKSPTLAQWICFCGTRGFATAVRDHITGEPLWDVRRKAIMQHDQHAKRKYKKWK